MPAGSALEQRVRTRLAALDAEGLRRTLRVPQGIDLSSNDYLNLSAHPLVAKRFIEGVMREGCGSTGSRLLRGERSCFAALESRFARFKGAERALFFGAGYLANIAVLTTYPEAGDVIFSDERNHASLIDGTRLSRARRLIFPHNDVERLEQMLAEADPTVLEFVVVESLFSMDGDVAPLAEYAAVCRRQGAMLLVDEAHAVGIYGDRGSGLIEAAGVGDEVCVSISTAGKALGAAGAFVAGPSWAIDYLIQRARPFVFSTAPPPALASALDASLTLVAEEPERRAVLLARAAYLRARLRAAGIDLPAGNSQIIPILIGDNNRAVAVARELQIAGFDVRAIRPPTVPAGTARLRVSVNAALSETALDGFVQALGSALRKVGAEPPASAMTAGPVAEVVSRAL